MCETGLVVGVVVGYTQKQHIIDRLANAANDRPSPKRPSFQPVLRHAAGAGGTAAAATRNRNRLFEPDDRSAVRVATVDERRAARLTVVSLDLLGFEVVMSDTVVTRLGAFGAVVVRVCWRIDDNV